MEKKILIVEDEKTIRDLITKYLMKEGYTTCSAVTGFDALRSAKTEHPDLIILDLMLPELDGLEVCKQIRADPTIGATPIIMLTAKNEESDMILGLEFGADDYITKPFSLKALVARVRALFRRNDRKQDDMPVYTFGPLVMNIAKHEVTVNGHLVALTFKEFGLLEHLLQNLGHIVTRDTLMASVWGDEECETTRTVDVHIRRLKQKLPLLEDAIISIKSLGYKLKEHAPK